MAIEGDCGVWSGLGMPKTLSLGSPMLKRQLSGLTPRCRDNQGAEVLIKVNYYNQDEV